MQLSRSIAISVTSHTIWVSKETKSSSGEAIASAVSGSGQTTNFIHLAGLVVVVVGLIIYFKSTRTVL
jgi:hypothetical protein